MMDVIIHIVQSMHMDRHSHILELQINKTRFAADNYTCPLNTNVTVRKHVHYPLNK